MVKRKCGTCRHFSDGGVAGSGWCQHPARRDLQHIVLVRKSELACRNGWDQDLWEQGAELSSSGSAESADQFSSRNGTAPPFTADMIPDPISADSNVGEIFTDKIQSIGLSLRPADPAQPIGPTPATPTELDHAAPDSRSVVREARRRRQEQRSEEQRRHQRALADAAGAMLEHSGQADPPQHSATTQSVPPPAPPRVERPGTKHRVPVGEIRRPANIGDGPAKATRKSQGRPERDTDEWIEVRGSADQFGEPKSLERDALTVRHDIGGGTEPLPIEQLRVEMAADAMEPPPVRVDVPAAVSPFIDPPIPHRETTWITGAGAIGKARRQPRPEMSADGATQEARLPLAMPRDPVDAFDLASSVPRCCATCRDFKRVGDGTRGWCVNPHAFTERRMVQSDDISCRSSIGTWWLPSDDLWLERVDMTHHGRPTPLLDQLHGDDLVEGLEMESRPY